MFGPLSTMTTVVERFPEGLASSAVRCSIAAEVEPVPPEILTLIDRANEVLQRDAPGIVQVRDAQLLAPCSVARSIADIDAEHDTTHLDIKFQTTSYRDYAACAFAGVLAQHDHAFKPLLDFVHAVPDRSQPAPATRSMGVRVLVETADGRLVVARRSGRVKMNPHVWTISANEGVRLALLKPGVDASSLLGLAVEGALRSELGLTPSDYDAPLLLTLYRNEYSQWGASFRVRTDLRFELVKVRQSAARHNWEYEPSQLESLPLDPTDCARAMADLGRVTWRWYGGALESLCAFLCWRGLGTRDYRRADDIASILHDQTGGQLVPVDAVNLALLPRGWRTQ